MPTHTKIPSFIPRPWFDSSNNIAMSSNYKKFSTGTSFSGFNMAPPGSANVLKAPSASINSIRSDFFPS